MDFIDPGSDRLRRSLTAYKGYLTHEETSGIQNRPWVKPEVILGIADRKLDFAPAPTTTKSAEGRRCFFTGAGRGPPKAPGRKPLVSQSAVVISCIFMV